MTRRARTGRRGELRRWTPPKGAIRRRRVTADDGHVWDMDVEWNGRAWVAAGNQTVVAHPDGCAHATPAPPNLDHRSNDLVEAMRVRRGEDAPPSVGHHGADEGTHLD